MTLHERRGLAWSERQLSTGDLRLGAALLDLDAVFAEVDATAVAD